MFRRKKRGQNLPIAEGNSNGLQRDSSESVSATQSSTNG